MKATEKKKLKKNKKKMFGICVFRLGIYKIPFTGQRLTNEENGQRTEGFIYKGLKKQNFSKSCIWIKRINIMFFFVHLEKQNERNKIIYERRIQFNEDEVEPSFYEQSKKKTLL